MMRELEVSLHMAFVEARQKRHRIITRTSAAVFAYNPSAAEVLRAWASGGVGKNSAFIAEHT